MRTLKQILEKEDSQTLLMKCYLDPAVWCERVIGLNIAPFHREWLKMAVENDRVAILAPTGHGKSEILAIAYNLWLVWFNERKEILIISKDMEQSKKILERIKNTIENNELLKDLVPERKDGWTKTEINTSTKCKIFCKSYNQKETLKSYHVDYIICDEVASYEDPDIFKRYIVTRCVAKKGKLIAVSTPVSITDLMQELLNNDEYASGKYPCIVDGKPIWPNQFSLKRYNQIKAEIGISAFEREYMVNPSAQAEDCLFPPGMVLECFDYTNGFRTESSGGDIIIGGDFAISSGLRADFDAYIVIEKVGDISMIVHGERHKGTTIETKVRRLQELYDQFRPRRFIVDESQIGSAIIQELRARGIPVEGAKFDPASRNKRIVLLRQLIEKKKISIPRNKNDPVCMNFTTTLVDEMIKFKEKKTAAGTTVYISEGAHDDTVMALTMAIEGTSNVKKAMDLVVVK